MKRWLWCYVLCVTALALVAYPLLLGDWGGLSRSDMVAGAILLVASPIAELLVVHIHFRKNAHSFSLLELPLVAGLMTSRPLVVVVAYSLGGAVVLLIHRRQPPMKLLFNTATFALTATIAAWLFTLLPHPGATDSPASWQAAFVACLASSVVGTTLVFGVISVAEGRLALRQLRTSLFVGIATSAGGTSVGIACAILATTSLAAVIFVAGPLAAVFLANRAYERERQRRENLEVIYDTSRTLTDEPETEQALFGALARCDASLPGDFTAACLPFGSQQVICFRVDRTGQHRSVEPLEPLLPLLERAAQKGIAWKIESRPPGSDVDHTAEASADLAALAPITGDTPLVEALAAPLLSGSARAGVVVVGSYGDSFRHFGQQEIELFQTVVNSIAAHTRLDREANEDSLTHLPNRRRMLEQLDRVYSEQRAREIALLLIDLDDFKAINDTFGHGTGDELLVGVASRLLGAAPDAVVSRLGGDEFTVLVNATTLQDCITQAEAVREAFRAPIATKGDSFPVRLSIGAALGASADTPAVLLRNADTALYESKRLGKGQTRIFDETMHERTARRYLMAEALRRALEHDQTTVVMQPIVELSSGRLVGAEALSRWSDPELGPVSAAEFVSVAEENGLSTALASRVITKVVESLEGRPGQLKISLNVSPGDLSNKGIIESLLNGSRRVYPHVITVEITERLIIADPAIFEILRNLQRGGVHVAIDDFGTGYSSLSYLKDVPANYLKVPREFVKDITANERSFAVVDAIAAVGRALGLQVIAEGVETAEQHQLLTKLGTTEAQGYLFGRPVPMTEFFDRSLTQRRAA